MIKLEHVVLASPEQMEFIIEGMRNPMNSWKKSDSGLYCPDKYDGYVEPIRWKLGENDHSLMQRLSKAGTDHRKFMRMMPVYVRITAPLYWWKEFDTYKVGTVANSCSTMHKIQAKEFTLENFSCEHLINAQPDGLSSTNTLSHMDLIIEHLNYLREKWLWYEQVLKSNELYGADPLATREEIKEKQKSIWHQMIQFLPSSYNQIRNVMMNYEVLANIYKSRKNHKLDEWRKLCSWIETLPYSELITGGVCGELKPMSPEELKREKEGLEKAMKNYNPDDGVGSNVILMKE